MADDVNAPRELPRQPLPKSPKRPTDQTTPPYTPGGVPEPEGDVPHSTAERTPPPSTLPPKRKP